MRSLPSLTFTVVLTFLAPFFTRCNSDTSDPYEGAWDAIEKSVPLSTDPDLPRSRQRFARPLFKKMEIRKLGKVDVQYHVLLDDDRVSLTFRKLNDTTMYNLSGDTILLIYNPKNKTLKFSETSNNFIGIRSHYFPDFRRSKYDVLQQELTSDTFFDYDIAHFQSGNINNFVPDRRLLPFRISPRFIKDRAIGELEITICLIDHKPKAIPADTANYYTTIEFNPEGHIQQITGKMKGGREQWLFERRNDDTNSLKRITYTNSADSLRVKEYLYDNDEWLVDPYGQKVLPAIPVWELGPNDLPSKLTLKNKNAWVEFEYTGNDLTRMKLYDDDKREEIDYIYSNGILTHVNWATGIHKLP
jgi:hypothetical protein